MTQPAGVAARAAARELTTIAPYAKFKASFLAGICAGCVMDGRAAKVSGDADILPYQGTERICRRMVACVSKKHYHLSLVLFLG